MLCSFSWTFLQLLRLRSFTFLLSLTWEFVTGNEHLCWVYFYQLIWEMSTGMNFADVEVSDWTEERRCIIYVKISMIRG